MKVDVKEQCKLYIIFVLIHRFRQDYEKAINSVTVKVFWAQYFTYNGLLQIKQGVSNEAAYAVITIDKRSTIGTLRSQIKEVNIHILVILYWEFSFFFCFCFFFLINICL